jgi:DNA polymerase (family 10)
VSPQPVTNLEIARVFARIAAMLEIDGANSFRVRAYREAARVVETQAEPMASLALEPGRLEALRGIGRDLAQKIRDVATTGTTELYEEMKAKVPLDVVALTELQGMGPKRVKTVMERLGVRNRAELEAAARAGRLRELPGFGETVERNVLKAIEATSGSAGRMLLGSAWPVAHAFAESLRGVPGVLNVELAGSFRRRRESIADLDILVCGGEPTTVMNAFVSYPEVVEVLGRGDTKSSLRLLSGLQVDLRLVAAESLGAALLYFTGSKAHNIELRRLAIEKELMLNEYGLSRDQTVIAGRTEEDVYAALGLSWIPPELREAHGEIARAAAGTLPKLLELSDIRGDLHMHTVRTDGRDTLESMVRAARDRGYEYCAITEHSQALSMIRGFDAARVRKAADEIAEVRRQVPGIEVLHGIEVDILPDGSLDLDDETLGLLDWVVASIHSRLSMPEAEMTERVVKALGHPAVCAMGHPTGRRIGTREPVAFDMERVLARAAECGVLVELSAQPDRLDLPDVHARRARELGVRFVIDTDAHSVPHLDFMRYGVFLARRAGLEPEDVINTRPYAGLREHIEERQRRARAKGIPATAPARPDPRR